MNKIHKRTVAVILAVCSLLSLLVPAVFADAQSISYYTSLTEQTALSKGLPISTAVEQENVISGDAVYVADSAVNPEQHSVDSNGVLVGKLATYPDGVTCVEPDYWAAIELQNVQQGVYAVNFWNQRYNTSNRINQGKFEVYVMPSVDYMGMDNATLQAAISAQLVAANKLPVNFDCSLTNTEQNAVGDYGTVEFKTSGSYLLVFKCIGSGQNTTSTTRRRFSLNHVNLTPSTATADVSVSAAIGYYMGAVANTVTLGQTLTTNTAACKGTSVYLADSAATQITTAVDSYRFLVSNTAANNWIAISLNGVKKGVYDVDFWNQRYAASYTKSHGKFDVYILPGLDYTDMNRTQIQAAINGQLAAAQKLPTAWDSSATRDTMLNTTSYGKVEFAEDGNYVMVFQCTGAGAGNTVPSRLWLSLSQVDLIPADGTPDVTVGDLADTSPNITDLRDQITSQTVLANAVPSSAVTHSLVLEYNGHDYFVGTMRGGAFVVYDIDTQQMVDAGDCGHGTVRSICADGYGNIWVSGAAYFLYKYNLATGIGEQVSIPTNLFGVSSFNALGLTWDAQTAKLYFGSYNEGHIIMLDPITGVFENLSGHVDATPDDTLEPDSMYAGFGGLIVKDGYIYIGTDGDTNMDNVTSHHIVKFSIADREVVDSIDLVAEGCWGISGHFLTHLSLVGDVIMAGTDFSLAATVAVDISGDEMTLVDMGSNMTRGFRGYVSAPINGKAYCFNSAGALLEIDIETMAVTKPSGFSNGMAQLYTAGGSLVTIEGDSRLPGTSLVTFANNADGVADLIFHNIQTKETVVRSSVTLGYGAGNRLTPIIASPDGQTIYVGAYGDNRVTAFTPATGNVTYYPTISHQTDGLIWYNGYLYTGNYQSCSIGQVNTVTGAVDNFFSLHSTVFSQDRAHALAAGDNKIFLGTVPSKARLGGVLAWYDLETQLTYVAAGPNPEDVFYANTSVDTAQYIWYNAVTDQVADFDEDDDGVQDENITVDGQLVQRFFGLIDKQTICSITYKDGYIYGSTVVSGGSGSTPDPNSSAKIFVYDVEAMELVGELDLRQVLSGFPSIIESINVVAADPDVDGKFWAVVAGTLVSFTFDTTTNTFNVTEELSVSKNLYDTGSQWHPRSIIFSGDYMFVSLNQYGICMLRRDNPREGYLLAGSTGHYEMVLGADNNLYYHNDYDIVRLNTASLLQSVAEQAENQ